MSIITKWGNSLAVRIPKHITEALNLKDGDEVSIALKDNRITIAAIAKKKKYTLDELLDGARSDDFDGEVDWGESVGKEVW